MKEYLRENPKGVFKAVPYDSSRSGDIEIPDGAEICYFFSRDYLRSGEDDFTFYKNGITEVYNGEEDDWINTDSSCFDFILNKGKVIWKREQETVNRINRNEFNPLVPQEGGDHYKLRPIQPIEYSERNGLSMSQGNIVKYITRHKEKNGVEDLAKVVHYALLEAYFVYDVKGSTELKIRIMKMLGD